MNITVAMIKERIELSGNKIPYSHGKDDVKVMGARVYDGVPIPGALLIGEGDSLAEEAGIDWASVPKHEDAVICLASDTYFFLQNVSVISALNCVLDAFAFFTAFEKDMLKVANNASDLQQLMDIAEPYFGNPMFIGNWQGQVFAYTKGFANDFFRPVWHHIVTKNRLPLSSVQILRNHPENLAYFINENNVSIYDFPEENFSCIIGWLGNSMDFHYYVQIMQHTTPISETTRTMAELLLDAMRSINPPHIAASISDTFCSLLDGNVLDNERLGWILAAFGWEESDEYMLLSFGTDEGALAAEALCGELQQCIIRGISFLWNARTIMLIREEDFKATYNDIERLIKQLSFVCGVSIPSSDWNNLPVSFKQAEIAIDYGNGGKPISLCSEHIWKYILREMQESMTSSSLCHPAVSAIVEHDQKRGSQLLHTLYTYLVNERNQSLAAQKLFIHRNTLLNRLQRINDMTGVDLDDNNVRLHILLSCYMYENPEKNIE